MLSIASSAQVKKTHTSKGNKTTAKPFTKQKASGNTIKQDEVTDAPKEAPTKNTETDSSRPSEENKNKQNTPEYSTSQAYKAAVGVKFLWGIGLTGKYFFKPNQAIEAIVRYRSYGGLGNQLGVAALYEYHGEIKPVEGLRYYGGGGVFYTDSGVGSSNAGVSAVIGLEYKIKELPIALSADWMPSYNFINGSGFGAENGGLGIKYTF